MSIDWASVTLSSRIGEASWESRWASTPPRSTFSVVGASGAVAVQADTVAPLPTIGPYGFHALSSEWMLLGRADLFALDVGDYSGSLLNINLAAEYQIVEQVGVGVGYRYVDLNLTSNKTISVTGTDFRGEFDYQLSGPKLYLTVVF